MRVFATILVAVVSFGAGNAWTKDYFNRSGLAFPLLLESESDVRDIIARAEERHAANPELENSVTLAEVRAMTGKHEEAIAMLRALEERYPGEAAVAAGLGAAFELSGNDAEALEWIREFAARDPKAEDSSEWLHIRILEAKIGLARDPEWLRHNPVLGVTFGAEPHPEPPEEGFADETGRVLYATDVRLAIMHQLNLRLQMFPTPDAMLGDLYMSAADLQIAFNVPFHQPLLQYRCAIELGVPNATLAKLRHDTFAAGNPPAAANAKRMFKRCRYKTLAPYGTHTRFPTGVIATLIVMCGVIFVSWARARRRQR